MKIKTITREQALEEGKKYGFTQLPKDHPIRFEGISMTFSSRMQKQLQEKAVKANKESSPDEPGTSERS